MEHIKDVIIAAAAIGAAAALVYILFTLDTDGDDRGT
jgi:hypothetical protein